MFVQLWDVPAETDDPYSSFSVDTLWDQVFNYWNANMSFVHRDLVHFFTGKGNPIDAYGVVNSKGKGSICGSHDVVLATHDNGEWWRYSYSVSSEKQSIGKPHWRSAAHEIGHLFDLYHICQCGIMDSGADCSANCGEATLTLFSGEADKLMCKYLNVLNGPYNRPNDVCLVEPPPVDYTFNLILESDEVIIGNFGEIICSGETITASFYNQFDPYTNISWSYSSNLTLINNPAANIKEFQTGAAGDAYISVTFDYQGQTVTYERLFHIGPPTALMGPYGIQITPNVSPVYWDIFYYEVPYASIYTYKVDGFNQLGQAIFSETGTTTDLSPFYTIPNDICVKVIIRAGNDCGLSSQNSLLTICPPGYSGVIPLSAAENSEATKRNYQSPKAKPVEKLVVYPNPTSGWLTIQAPGQQFVEAYELFNVKGQKVASGTSNKPSVRIKTPNISGVYWLRIQTTEGISLQKVVLE